MPKIRDLGINVIPEITRPPEVGQGGGCGPTRQYTECGATDCSGQYQQNYGCAWTMNCGGATLVRSVDCPGAQQQYEAPCGGPTFGNSANCPRPQYQGQAPCGGPTFGNSANCYQQQYRGCGGSTVVNSVDCYQAPCGGSTVVNSVDCYRCYGGTQNCGGATVIHSPYCPPGGLTREAIAQLKEQLQKQIEQLDEYAKSIGPKTAEEIDAREKELNAELEDLARRRQELGK